MEPLLTIITPCHNSEEYVERLLNSVLNQTYPNIEMIMVDNASTDQTAEIIHKYIPKFVKRGYSLVYYLEDDLGPSIGLRNGMQFMHGDYLTFPDSDDYYSRSDSLEIMIKRFESLPDEYAVVRSKVQQIDENTMEPCGLFGEDIVEGYEDSLFEDCLFCSNGYYYVNIGFMIRVSSLKEIIGMDFYAAYNVGPGRQVYCPLYYYKKCYSIPQVLSNYLVRANSISHSEYSKYEVRKKLYKNCSEYYKSILSKIPSLNVIEKNKLYKKCLYLETKSLADMALQNNLLDYFKLRTELLRYSNRRFKDISHTIKHLFKTLLNK